MHRKRDNYEIHHNQKDLLTKKIKSDQSILNNNNQSLLQSANTFVMDSDRLAQNDRLNLTILSKLSTQVYDIF
jgi:hypothetical protein